MLPAFWLVKRNILLLSRDIAGHCASQMTSETQQVAQRWFGEGVGIQQPTFSNNNKLNKTQIMRSWTPWLGLCFWVVPTGGFETATGWSWWMA